MYIKLNKYFIKNVFTNITPIHHTFYHYKFVFTVFTCLLKCFKADFLLLFLSNLKCIFLFPIKMQYFSQITAVIRGFSAVICKNYSLTVVVFQLGCSKS